MALSAASQTAMNNRRRQNAAQSPVGSGTTFTVVDNSGQAGHYDPSNPGNPYGRQYVDYRTAGEVHGPNYWANSPTAVGTPAPTATPWTPYSPPGYGEDWWQSHKTQWDQPGQSSNYWNGVQGFFTNPTQQEQQNQQYSNTVGSTPGALENLYNQYNGSGTFTNPGAGEQWWAQNGGQYGQTGAMEDWYAKHGSDFNQAGDMERFNQQNQGRLQGNDPLGQNSGGIADTYNSAQNTGAFFGATAGDLLTPSYTEALANNYQRMPSYNEQFLLGGGATQGLDQLYQRLASQEAKRLDNRAAAGGSFNSGAALRAQEESGADFAAQHVRDYMAASQAADTSRLADQSYGLNLMQGADTGLRGRISLGLTGANMVDQNTMQRAHGLQDLYTGVGDETRANIGLGATMAQNSQADWLAREQAGQGAAQGANTAWLDRLNAGGSAASRAQGDEQSRVQMGLGAAGDAQNAWMDRYKTAFGMNNDLQAQALARIMAGGTLATSASNEDYRRLAGGLDAALAAQNAKQNRENGVFNNVLGLGSAQAGTYGSQTGAANTEQANLMMDQINGLLKRGQISAEQAQARYGEQLAALGLIIQGGQVVSQYLGKSGTASAKDGGGGGFGGTDYTVSEPTYSDDVYRFNY